MELMQPSEYVSEFILTRNRDKTKSFVLVEGTTDRALWAEYAADNCHLRPAKGKDIIIDVLNTPFLRGLQGIAGIIDSDYWLITKADELSTENLLYDDCCSDMESLLLNSDALKKVLRHSINIDDTEQIHQFADRLKAEAQRLAIEFGYFRLLNHLKDYGLRCNAIRFEDVIDCAALELDRVMVASKLSGDKPGLTGEDLLRQVDELKDTYSPDDARLCRGKDVVAIMAHILPALFKTEFGAELDEVGSSHITGKALAKDLRMAYEFGYFIETSLFACIRRWECENIPFRIIKESPYERT